MKSYLTLILLSSVLNANAVAQTSKEYMPVAKCVIEKYMKQCLANTGNKKTIIDYAVELNGLNKENFLISKKGGFASVKIIKYDFKESLKGEIIVFYEDETSQTIKVTLSNEDNIEKSKKAVSGLKMY